MTNKIKQMFARMSAQLVKPTLAIFAMLAIGGAWGDQHNWLGAQGTQLYWEDSSSWSDPEATTVTEWIINVQGAKVGFKTAYAQNYVEGDTAPLIILSGNEAPIEFTADDDNSAYGLTKNGALDVGAWWSGYGTGNLKVNSGTYSFTDINVGRWANLNGNLTVAGGTVIANNVYVGLNDSGNTANGTITISGDGELKMGGLWGQSTGSVVVNGGKIIATIDNEWFINGEITFTVGENGATIDTNGKTLTIIPKVIGSGTLNITGGGYVTFAVRPTCSVVSLDNTPYVMPDPVNTVYYWVGGTVGEGSRLAFNNTAGKWSQTDGGEPIADFIPGEGDTAVFTASGVNLFANNIAANIRALADVGFYNHDTKNDYTMSGDLYVETGVTLSIKALKAHKLTQTGAVTGSGTLRAYAETQSSTVDISGDTSAFTGNVNFVVGSDNTLAACRIANAAAANNALSSWNVFLTENSIVPYRDSTRTGYTAFPLSDTTYRFGALNAVVSYPDKAPANSTFVIGGRDNEDSSVYGQFQSGGNTIVWNADSAVNPDVTYTHGVINCAGLTVTGGGIVKFTAANAFPAAFTLSNKGAYLGMTTDADFNAAVAAAVTTVDADVPVGFYSSETEETFVNLLSANALVGKTLCKRGAGTVYVTNLPASGVNDIVVSEGTLVLPHGAVVGDVTVAQGASLVIDLIGAEDNEVVFAYDSVSGNATYRNKASIGEVVVDDAAKTWTFNITGSSRTFTWIGTDGASWNDANNWLADGELTTDIPTAIDTVQFSESANISASGTLAGDVQIATGVTLTIPAGLTFSKLTAASGATIAFSSGAIATVGGTLTLITVGEASGVAAALDLPATYGVSVDSETGAITATRNAGTYTWIGAKDSNWATGGNWKVGDIVVADVPAAEDSVVFPASDAEGFEGWTVTLPWDVYADTVTLNANVILSGARTLKTHTINGTAELKLSNAHIGCNGQDIVVNCPLNILPETTDYIYLSGYNATLNGPLYGSGKLVSDANKAQYRGVTFKGDVSEFYGEFEATNYANRDATNMTSPAIGSENAVWRTNPHPGTGSAQQSTHFVIHDSETTYKFGAYVGGFWVGNIATPHIEIGKRGDVDSSFGLTSLGSRSRFVFTKVGGGSMTITNGKGDEQIGTLYPNGGTSIIRTLPGTITFGGGALKTPIYDTVLGKATKYVYVNQGDATDEKVLDEDVGESVKDGDVVYAFKETRQVDVVGPYYPDVSSVIKDSTGPIYFTDDGADYTWATALAESNRGGLIKDGAGTLTLSAEPLYLGPTWVKAGKIVFPNGTEVTLDPRTVGTAENARVDGYKYMANTVLYGNEPGSDVEGDVDVSGVVKIDISNSSFVDALVDDRVVVLCRTTGRITGRDSKKFVQGETLLVPEKPEDVSEKRWDWMVRVMQIGGKNCLCVAPRTTPFSIKLR